MFERTSRYHGIETAHVTLGDGRTVVYVRRRFVPLPGDTGAGDAGIGEEVGEHVVTQGERLDHIAFRHLGDPELFWRLCDANGAMRPDELTAEIGRRLIVPAPQGAR